MSATTAPFFTVFSAERGAGPFAERCISSLRAQSFKNWECFFVDDASSDSTYNLACNAADADPRFTLALNKERRFKLTNFLHYFPAFKGRVIVELDGDDWWADDEALARIAACYERGAEATFGSHRAWPSGLPNFAPTPPCRGSRLAVNGFASGFPAPRTWRCEFTERSLREFPEMYIDPYIGVPWRYNADFAMFAPALTLAERVTPIEEVLATAQYAPGTLHDSTEAAAAQHESAGRLYELWREKEWELQSA